MYIMIVLFIVPFMFPSKHPTVFHITMQPLSWLFKAMRKTLTLSTCKVLFIFTFASVSYYAIVEVSVVSKVRKLVNIL